VDDEHHHSPQRSRFPQRPGHSDFKSKVEIALKEARESHVRLKTCLACRYGPTEEAAGLTKEADEIVAILVTIVKNTIRNSEAPSRRARR